MADPLPTTTLAWLRQTAKFEGAVTAQVLLHLLERVEALEQRPTCEDSAQVPPTPEAALVATDEQILAMRSWSSHGPTFDSDLVDFARAVLARWGHPAAPPASEPGEVGELVDRLGWIAAQLGDIGWSDDSASVARAATLLLQLSAPAPVLVPVAVADDRNPECVACWPECVPGGYDPRCCRFPKSCSCAHAIPLPQAGEGEA
jgi:hypothetical protein